MDKLKRNLILFISVTILFIGGVSSQSPHPLTERIAEFGRLVNIFENMDPQAAGKILQALYERGSKDIVEDIIFHPSLSIKQCAHILTYVSPSYWGDIFSNPDYSAYHFNKLTSLLLTLPVDKASSLLFEIAYLSPSNAAFIIKKIIEKEKTERIPHLWHKNFPSSLAAQILLACFEEKRILTAQQCAAILCLLPSSRSQLILKKVKEINPSFAHQIETFLLHH